MTTARPIFVTAFILLAAAALPGSAWAEDISANEEAIIRNVDETTEAQIAFIERVVNINSGTMNLAGVRAVGDAFAAGFRALGMTTEWLDMPQEMNRAGHLVARTRGTRGEEGGQGGGSGKRLLLLGHLDTVFPKDSPFQKFERAAGGDGNTATGPGVEDMKAGNATILYALRALHAVGALESSRITVMLTGDEELAGAPLSLSRQAMIALGKEADAALSFESGTIDTAVVARRGSSNWQLYVKGKRAHSSGIFNEDNGAGAVFEAARILNAFYEELRGEEYLTFNPGVIAGGTEVTLDIEASSGTAFGKTNVIAQDVMISGGLRFLTQEQLERARGKMREIVARSLPHTSARIDFQDRYPGMAPTAGNLALFEVLKGVNADLDMPVPTAWDPGKRGAGDISFVAPFVASIDGLGPTGEGGHTPGESLDLTSVAPMTKRAALLIYRLTRE
ncbi:MAG: M20/M25/M40 family metallo-hydrolase [Proteobacteria bacterium]|nr:M20/M25/M40 family metallo-hydrolase [Pseudomonadota bacterium]